MSLITDIGSTAAESLCDVATALTYHADRGNSTWATITTTQQEQALRRASDYLEAVYSQRWQGLRVNNVQALSWPRVGVTVNDYYVLADIVPIAVINACAELALKAAGGELLSDTTQQKIRTKVDGLLEVEYDKYSPKSPKFLMIESMLRPYLCDTSGIVHRLLR
jgi:hypothetical protein